ncbi:MAG: glycosyltransferase [Myxococcales bacterium]
MSARLRVLVYGGIGAAACDFYRRAQFVSALAAVEVDLVPWTPPLLHPSSYAGRWFDALRDGVARVDLTALEQAQVVLFSRWSNTHVACTVCSTACESPPALDEHARVTGHHTLGLDPLLRLVATSLLFDKKRRAGCAVMYDLDDDLFRQPEWVGHGPGLARELDLVELFLRAADLITVSTPALQQAVRPFSPRTHVVRNAVEPALYQPSSTRHGTRHGTRPGTGKTVRSAGYPRILFYGADVRQRDYLLCAGAVDAAVRCAPGARRIWLGSDSREVRALVDEAYPSVDAGPLFTAKLADLGPHIGLAPLQDSEFARSKSELHWLEYSMVGAVTVASRLDGAGPYDVVKDGQDGFLAGDPGEWRTVLTRLIGAPALHAEVAERARERVLAEYQAGPRALEWAAAYRWAANHPGTGGGLT